MSETVEQIVAFLVADGWQECPDELRTYARAMFKQFDTPTRCRENDDKGGIQVGLYVSESICESGTPSIEMELYGGLPDDTCIHLHNYSLRRPVAKILTLIPRLISTWEHIANYKEEAR